MGEWNKNKAFGNISESIIEMLINSMPNWKCIKFGVENHIEELRKAVREKITDETRKIKSMPDFIAFNTKTHETLFIEVKYRGFIDKRIAGKSEYKLDFLEEYLEHWKGTKLIIVHPYKPNFFVINLDDVKMEMRHKKENGIWWDFASIEKNINDLFPDLKEDVLEDAKKLIPSDKE